MAIKFNFRKEKIVTDASFFMFSEFKNLWGWDKSKDKKKANKMFYFLFLLCDLTETNPLKDTPASRKEEEALYRTYKNRAHTFTKKELELLEPAIKCYIKYNEMPEERILSVFDNKSDQLRKILSDTGFETVENICDGVSSFVSNSEIITGGLKELDHVKTLKASVIAAIKKDAMSQKIRGQVVLSPLSKGNIALASFSEMFSEK